MRSTGQDNTISKTTKRAEQLFLHRICGQLVSSYSTAGSPLHLVCFRIHLLQTLARHRDTSCSYTHVVGSFQLSIGTRRSTQTPKYTITCMPKTNTHRHIFSSRVTGTIQIVGVVIRMYVHYVSTRWFYYWSFVYSNSSPPTYPYASLPCSAGSIGAVTPLNTACN